VPCTHGHQWWLAALSLRLWRVGRHVEGILWCGTCSCTEPYLFSRYAALRPLMPLPTTAIRLPWRSDWNSIPESRNGQQDAVKFQPGHLQRVLVQFSARADWPWARVTHAAMMSKRSAKFGRTHAYR
jgi:hypothetical protein